MLRRKPLSQAGQLPGTRYLANGPLRVSEDAPSYQVVNDEVQGTFPSLTGRRRNAIPPSMQVRMGAHSAPDGFPEHEGAKVL